jgi:hypothetical protein
MSKNCEIGGTFKHFLLFLVVSEVSTAHDFRTQKIKIKKEERKERGREEGRRRGREGSDHLRC